jgi:cytochrome c-type biogenesis protein CcmH
MTVFWLVAVLLIIAALLFLLPPLVQKSQRKDALGRDELNVAVFKDQLAELERDREAGVVTSEQFEAARQDLERSFLQESGDNDSSSNTQMDLVIGRSAAVVIGVLVPVLAVSLYAMLGSGELGLNPETAQPQVQAEGHEGTLEEQVRQLQDHLQTNPDDIEGWAMLGRSHYFLKQYAAASEAFERASSMLQDSKPELLVDYADALAMANGRNMAGRPYELVKKALETQPTNEKALWLAGTASYQAQDYPTTLEYWKRLLQIFPEGSENYLQMQRNIADIQQQLGMPADAEIETTTTAAVQARISGVVRLAPGLTTKISSDDTVFVFARAASGPRMPLAIVRKQVKDLPLEFTLDDAMAMNPAMKLSRFQQVMVGARISKSGNAMPQAGDLQGEIGPVGVNGVEGLELLIDSIVD